MTLSLLLAAAWTFHSAPNVVHPATGRDLGGGAYELRVPDRASCGWWETSATFRPHEGVRLRATVEVALDDAAGDAVYNDLTMFVRWEFPKDGKDRSKSGNGVDKGRFYQRDFVAYTDRVENGRLIRTFDETYASPKECSEVEIEFIGKWHAMTAVVRDLRVENVERPKPRLVRCVVGNPHEFWVDWKKDPVAAKAARLAKVETTLTNIFANVEKPDLVLFSENFIATGAPNGIGDEPVPGGPSWRLAEKYATKYRCNISFNIIERTAEGQRRSCVFVCDRNGKLAGRYYKCHLTSGEYQGGMIPGDGYPVFDLDFGRVGALVCWDNWFSESIKLAKRNGAELLLFPLAGCAWDHVDICFPARAIDAGIPILVAMRQGHLPNGIIDRDGQWIAKTMEDCGYAVADLDLNERKRTFWLSVGAGPGDPFELYYDEARPEIYEKFDFRQPRHPSRGGTR